MTIFNGYMKIVRSNINIIIMYFMIFTMISVLTAQGTKSREEKQYTANSLDIAVVDRAENDLSKALLQYLGQFHHVTVEEDRMEELQERLYYYNIDIVLQIPKEFGTDRDWKKGKVQITEVPGDSTAMYLEQQINGMLQQVQQYEAAGYSQAEAIEKLQGQKQSKISILKDSESNANVKSYTPMLRMIPYFYIPTLCSILGLILAVFQRKDMKQRMSISSISLWRQNVEALMAFLVLGVGLWLLSLGVIQYISKGSFFHAQLLPYYLANTFVMMLVTLSLAFFIGILVKKAVQVNMIVTPFSLGLCFICGVFVPLKLLGEQVKRVAQFLPVYWYSKNNDLLGEYQTLPAKIQEKVWQGIGIQLVFMAAIIGVTLMLTKMRQQER